MESRIATFRKRCEEQLSRLEDRLHHRPADTGREYAGRETQQPADCHATENRALHTRINVQKREIDDLKAQLAESRRSQSTMAEVSRQQQSNVARMVKEWEQRLAVRGRQDAADAAGKSEGEKEIAFLKAEVAMQDRRIEELHAQKNEYEQAAQVRDSEIARLFAQLQALEEENALLVQKVGTYQLAARSSKHPHAPVKESRRLFSWLSKPLIVVRTPRHI